MFECKFTHALKFIPIRLTLLTFNLGRLIANKMDEIKEITIFKKHGESRFLARQRKKIGIRSDR